MDKDKLDLLKSLSEESSNQNSTSFGKKKLLILILVIGSVVVSLIFLLTKITNSEKKRPSETQNKPQIASPVLKREDNVPSNNEPIQKSQLVASGYVVARRIATIAAETTGRIEEVLVEEGMRVEKGQLIAKLDTTLVKTDRDLAQAQLSSSLATIDALSAQLNEANFLMERNGKLYRTGVLSESSFVEARTKSASLSAQLEQAKSLAEAAKIEVLRRNELIEKSLLRAPFAGIVIDKNAQPGEIISPMSAGGGFTRTGIATIVDMDSLEIEVDVNESNISKVKPKQEAFAILDAYPQLKIPAEVIAIIPTANKDKATIRVRVKLKEKDPRILPNMAVKVYFLMKEI